MSLLSLLRALFVQRILSVRRVLPVPRVPFSAPWLSVSSGPFHSSGLVAAGFAFALGSIALGSIALGSLAPASAQTFEAVVTAEALPSAAAATDVTVADPLFYNPAGADGQLGTADDDYRGDRVAGSPLIDAAKSTFATSPVALNGIQAVDGGPNAFDSERDIGAFESHEESLPVELAGLEGRYLPGGEGLADDRALVRWHTLQETANAYFQVQVRPADAQAPTEGTSGESAEATGANAPAGAAQTTATWTTAAWTTAARVDGAGTTTDPQSYRTEVALPSVPSAAVEVRLRQVDVDGSASLSDPIRIQRVGLGRSILVAPNPARHTSTLSMSGLAAETADIEVFDLLGRRVWQRRGVSLKGGAATVTLDAAALASGTYLVRVAAPDRPPLTLKWTVLR